MSDPHASASTASYDALFTADRVSADAVPEFLWYDLAVEALEPQAPVAAKLAALKLLARAPRSWDAVTMHALTSTDLAVQLQALDTLRAHAVAVPERLGAFEALGDLPGWAPAAQAAWQAAWREIADDHEAARRARVLDDLQAQTAMLVETVEHLSVENSTWREAADVAIRAEAEALERLETLEAAMTTEVERLEQALAAEAAIREAGLAEERRRRANEAAIHHAELAMLERAKVQALAGRRRWSIIAACSVAAAVVPMLILASGLAPVMATEPHSVPLTKEANAAGFSDAEKALAGEAARLELAGSPVAAEAAWRALSRIARDPAMVGHAGRQAEAIASRRAPAPQVLQAKPKPVPTAGKTVTAAPASGRLSGLLDTKRPSVGWPVVPHQKPGEATSESRRPLPVRAVPKHPKPVGGAASQARPVPPSLRPPGRLPPPPAATSDGIPADIRAKF